VLKNLKMLLACSSTFIMMSYVPFTQAKILKQNAYGILISPNLRVIDGDTIHFASQGEKYRIRLMGIDAPEKDQRFGTESTQALANCIRQAKKVQIEWVKKDKYDRLLAKVRADDTDCNLLQVKKGYAWHYKYYQDDQPFIDRYTYSSAEHISKQLKLGLWMDDHPIAPWDWRRKISMDAPYGTKKPTKR
jgi:micrococcal nuclease